MHERDKEFKRVHERDGEFKRVPERDREMGSSRQCVRATERWGAPDSA